MKSANDQLKSSNGNETRKSFHAKQANRNFTACDMRRCLRINMYWVSKW